MKKRKRKSNNGFLYFAETFMNALGNFIEAIFKDRY